MVRVDAGTNAAKVVELAVSGDRAVDLDVVIPVGVDHLSLWLAGEAIPGTSLRKPPDPTRRLESSRHRDIAIHLASVVSADVAQRLAFDPPASTVAGCSDCRPTAASTLAVPLGRRGFG